jgi:hypothetical protein
MTTLTFTYRGQNTYVSDVPGIPALIRAEASRAWIEHVLYADFGGDTLHCVGRYRTLEAASRAANGFFADELNSLDGFSLPRAAERMWA